MSVVADITIFVIICGSILLTFLLIHFLMTPRPRGGRRR